MTQTRKLDDETQRIQRIEAEVEYVVDHWNNIQIALTALGKITSVVGKVPANTPLDEVLEQAAIKFKVISADERKAFTEEYGHLFGDLHNYHFEEKGVGPRGGGAKAWLICKNKSA